MTHACNVFLPRPAVPLRECPYGGQGDRLIIAPPECKNRDVFTPQLTMFCFQ